MRSDARSAPGGRLALLTQVARVSTSQARRWTRTSPALVRGRRREATRAPSPHRHPRGDARTTSTGLTGMSSSGFGTAMGDAAAGDDDKRPYAGPTPGTFGRRARSRAASSGSISASSGLIAPVGRNEGAESASSLVIGSVIGRESHSPNPGRTLRCWFERLQKRLSIGACAISVCGSCSNEPRSAAE
jgi:hypothetical protein